MSEELLAQWTFIIQRELDILVPDKMCSYRTLYQAARYSLLSGGKRIRPLLTLAIVHLLQDDIKKAIHPVCALEIVHTYSLIHDDLPCMDDDDFRRGKPTLHKIYSEGHAVLVGDFLLTYAFEVLANAPSLSPQQKLKLISLLAMNGGGDGMIGGQVLDLSYTADVPIKEVHERKTGALFTASVQFAGVIAGCSPPMEMVLTQLGQKIGSFFQIVDDILDEENGFTYDDALHAHQSIEEILDTLPGDKGPLSLLVQKILSQVSPASLR